MSDHGNSTFDLTVDLGLSNAPDPNKVVAGRYLTKSALGSGGFGSVWRARDAVRDVDVAVKIISASQPGDLDQVRRELTALRWLNLPGVARMRDEGIDGNRWFIVMDLVEGTHFPGGATSRHWADLEQPIRSMLEVLARLHAAGIVHRDLKPANVLVDRQGRATIVDFGIASGRAGLEAPVDRFIGTPRYASPEQCAGQATDARSDLFSVGVMLFEALTGSVPHESTSRRDLMRQRQHEPAPPIRSIRPNLDPTVALAIDSLLQHRSLDRPKSALVILNALKGAGWTASSDVPRFDGRRTYSWQSLRSAFHGPDRFLHLQTDAARELFRRTGGQGRRLNRELEAWIRAGLAHQDGERIRIDRRSLEQLSEGLRVNPGSIRRFDDETSQRVVDHIRLGFPQAHTAWLVEQLGLSPQRFEARCAQLQAEGEVWRVGGRWFAGAEMEPVPHWTDERQRRALTSLAADQNSSPTLLNLQVSPGKSAPDLLRRASAMAEGHLGRGDHRRAATAIRIGLAHAGAQDAQAVDRLLLLRACAANSAGTLAGCNEALYLVDRYAPPSIIADAVQRLARGTRAYLGGETARALRLIAVKPDRSEPVFWLAWNRLRMQVARLQGPERVEQLLGELDEWSHSTPQARGAWLGWNGIFHYQRGRFEEAAELCLRASDLARSQSQRLNNRIDAAAALLESNRLSEAVTLAARAKSDARRSRQSRAEAVAHFIERTAAYRRRDRLRPQPATVDAAAEVSAYTGAIIAMTEGAAAWRAGRRADARKLSRRASALAAESGRTEIQDLMLALGCATGATLDVAALIERAQAHATPNTGVQVLGLLRLAGQPVDDAQLRELAARVPTERWTHRLDVLSVEECVGTRNGAPL